MFNQKLKLWHWLAIGLAIADLAILYCVNTRPDGLAHIYFLNVGQGDSILIKTADGQHILIDGGPDNEVVKLIDSILPPWGRQLDLVILTHPHADHATGLIEVARRYQINEFAFNGLPYPTETYNTLLNLIEARGIDINIIDENDKYKFKRSVLDIIHPLNSGLDISANPNDTSVVAIFDYLDFELLLTGDIGVGIEDKLIQNGSVLDVEALKVGHQGSRTSTSQDLLSIARPEVSIIAVGHNSYGHPHDEVVKRIKNFGSKLFRTDKSGTIEIVTDGHIYQVLTD
ncbi:hypothetical protein DRH29_01080 [candidate division Kazan bacterium]|uniref:Metallo-beta-lactamase domain-containing protein n=1 Tax=candidate division Kazan bacterium TaxID=2202143 RepID=A0A420ZDI4_UNCK3|nr:MAG: hypothetical protein DRH29_01080 [candidate division Kazan bacterium]